MLDPEDVGIPNLLKWHHGIRPELKEEIESRAKNLGMIPSEYIKRLILADLDYPNRLEFERLIRMARWPRRASGLEDL